jgi:hypothetical protein
MENKGILNQVQGYNVSDKYTPVTTQNLIDTLTAKGYVQTSLVKTKVRGATKEGFQKHMVRLAHADLNLKLTNVGDSRPEIVLVNSYDGSSSLKILLGIFRLVCSNGMVVGQNFGSYAVRHVGDIGSQIDAALTSIAGMLPKVSEKINAFNTLQLSDAQRADFAREAVKLILPETAQSVDLSTALTIRRQQDSKQDLWTVYNRVQESLIRGGVKYTSVSKTRLSTCDTIRHALSSRLTDKSKLIKDFGT